MIQSLEFWYEFASTYSYLSAIRIEELAEKNQIMIVWKPFLLGPIFKEQGWKDSPFNIYPVKGRYMWKDMARRTHKRGVPFKKPTVFPRNGLLAARIAFWGSKEKWCPAFTKKVFQSNFAEDQEIGEVETLTAILKSLRLDAEDIINQTQSQENKNLLKMQTRRAQQLGIFGAPSFIVGNELFWGDDRLEEAIDFLQENPH